MNHILFNDDTYRPWWPAAGRFDLPPNERLWCDCCNCWAPASEVDARLQCQEIPVLGDLGNYQDQQHPYGPDEKSSIGFQYSYYDATWRTRLQTH